MSKYNQITWAQNVITKAQTSGKMDRATAEFLFKGAMTCNISQEIRARWEREFLSE